MSKSCQHNVGAPGQYQWCTVRNDEDGREETGLFYTYRCVECGALRAGTPSDKPEPGGMSTRGEDGMYYRNPEAT